jgi:hypothetical protein
LLRSNLLTRVVITRVVSILRCEFYAREPHLHPEGTRAHYTNPTFSVGEKVRNMS